MPSLGTICPRYGHMSAWPRGQAPNPKTLNTKVSKLFSGEFRGDGEEGEDEAKLCFCLP